MPKGVEHYDIIKGKFLIVGLFSTLMPKGVEHIKNALFNGVFRLFSTLMPKGVEHTNKIETSIQNFLLFSTLMPKGVEHFCF